MKITGYKRKVRNRLLKGFRSIPDVSQTIGGIRRCRLRPGVAINLHWTSRDFTANSKDTQTD